MAKDQYDDTTRSWLKEVGAPSYEGATSIRKPSGSMPYTEAGIPGLVVRDMPYLTDSNARGFVLSSNLIADENKNRGMQPNIFMEPKAGPQATAHEIEHLLSRRNAGFTTETRDKFADMVGDPKWQSTVPQFLSGLKDSLPYLKEKYGIEDGYMTPGFIDKKGKLGLHEIFATLAGAESALNVDLTKDPELRKTMFSDQNVREAYNAVTGLRQTRLDPRDIPPYTRVPEPGMMDKVKKYLGFANGGYIENAGNNKLI
jgi:hypothetical protein